MLGVDDAHRPAVASQASALTAWKKEAAKILGRKGREG